MARQEPGDCQLCAATEEHYQNCDVSQDGQHTDEPDEDTQEGEAHDVLTWVEGIWLGVAPHFYYVLTVLKEVWLLVADGGIVTQMVLL